MGKGKSNRARTAATAVAARASAHSPAVRRTLNQVEAHIANDNVEHGVVIGLNGNIVMDLAGTYTYNALYDRYEHSISLSEEQNSRIGGLILTHNHPGGSGFSSADIQTAYSASMAEIRAVTTHFRRAFRVPRAPGMSSWALWMAGPPGGQPHRILYRQAQARVERLTQRQLARGRISLDAANFRHSDLVMRQFVKLIGAPPGTYRRTRWRNGETAGPRPPRIHSKYGPLPRYMQDDWTPDEKL